jgi:hypothetical protein
MRAERFVTTIFIKVSLRRESGVPPLYEAGFTANVNTALLYLVSWPAWQK